MPIENPYFIISSILILALLFLVSNSYLFRKVLLGKDDFKLKLEPLYFLAYSIIFIGVSFLLIKTIEYKKFTILTGFLNIILLTSVMIFSAFRVMVSIFKLVAFNFSFKKGGSSQNKIFTIYNFNEFVDITESIINQSKRLNLNTGIILLYIKNMEQLSRNLKEQEMSFLRKQIMFLLSQNSREYEPWGRTDDKMVYMKSVQYKSKVELELASKRFFSLITRHNFQIYDKQVEVKFCMLTYRYDDKKIVMDDETLHSKVREVIISLIEYVKRMKKDFEIIERV